MRCEEKREMDCMGKRRKKHDFLCIVLPSKSTISSLSSYLGVGKKILCNHKKYSKSLQEMGRGMKRGRERDERER